MRESMLGVLASALLVGGAAAQFQTTTYQGRLDEAGDAADGAYDLTFRLYDAPNAGTLIAGPIVVNDVDVADGLFRVELDFGIDAFNDDRWLEIDVDGQTLSPRQPVTATPVAHQLRGVTVSSEGYFGIGTSNPGAKLEVRENDTEAILGVSVFQNGVFGASAAASRAGVAGSTTSSSGFGVHGSVSVLNGSGRGVYGTSFGETGAGVYGLAQNLQGENYGVYGETLSTADYAAGVYGYASGLTGTIRGGYFATESSGNGASGIVAQALAASGNTYGVQASVASPNGRALSGFVANGVPGTALHATCNDIDGWAARMLGRVFMRDHTTVGKSGVQITTAEAFGVHTTAESGQFGGMYVSGQAGGSLPFYGYSAGGTGGDVDAYHYFQGNLDQWRLWCGAERIAVNRQNGRVGIGTTSPSFLLHVNGSAGKPGGGSWSVASDARLKKNVRRLDGALDSMLALEGVTFEYVDAGAIGELDGERMGLVAQDVERVFPDWIEDGDDGFKRMTVRGFEAVVIEAVRELRAEKDAQVADLEREHARRMHALERENEALRSRIEALESEVDALLEAETESRG